MWPLRRIPVLKARMNADLHMAEDLKNTGYFTGLRADRNRKLTAAPARTLMVYRQRAAIR